MPRRKAGPPQPRSLVVIKDGHVGSEWFAESLQRQPSTRFIFEMGPCITGSLEGKKAFVKALAGDYDEEATRVREMFVISSL